MFFTKVLGKNWFGMYKSVIAGFAFVVVAVVWLHGFSFLLIPLVTHPLTLVVKFHYYMLPANATIAL